MSYEEYLNDQLSQPATQKAVYNGTASRISNSFKIEEKTGNLHFHSETLRHNSGEFTLNRIFATPTYPKTPRNPTKTNLKYKKPLKIKKHEPLKSLINKTQLILTCKNTAINPQYSSKILQPEPPNRLRVKSRAYLKTDKLS